MVGMVVTVGSGGLTATTVAGLRRCPSLAEILLRIEIEPLLTLRAAEVVRLTFMLGSSGGNSCFICPRRTQDLSHPLCFSLSSLFRFVFHPCHGRGTSNNREHGGGQTAPSPKKPSEAEAPQPGAPFHPVRRVSSHISRPTMGDAMRKYGPTREIDRPRSSDQMRSVVTCNHRAHLSECARDGDDGCHQPNRDCKNRHPE